MRISLLAAMRGCGVAAAPAALAQADGADLFNGLCKLPDIEEIQ